MKTSNTCFNTSILADDFVLHLPTTYSLQFSIRGIASIILRLLDSNCVLCCIMPNVSLWPLATTVIAV